MVFVVFYERLIFEIYLINGNDYFRYYFIFKVLSKLFSMLKIVVNRELLFFCLYNEKFVLVIVVE